MKKAKPAQVQSGFQMQQANGYNYLGACLMRKRGICLLLLATLLVTAGCSKPEELAEAHLKKAMELIAKNNDEEGRLELYRVIKYKSDSVEAWRELAAVHERMNVPRLQAQQLRRVIELDPADHKSRIKLATLMLRGNAPDAAARVIESVSEDSANAELHALRGNILIAKKDLAGAVIEARKAAEIDPTNADAALILASERAMRGDRATALSLLDRARLTDPKDTRVALAKTQIHVAAGDLAKAEGELRGILTRNPGESSARLQLVQVLLRQRKMDDAEKELRAIADANPEDSKAGLELVRFIISTRGPAAGRQELEARIGKGGEVFPYQLALADVVIGERKPADAARLLERLVAEAKSTDDRNTAKVKLAEVKASLKDMAEAERLIADVLSGDRRNVGALRLRAAIRIDRGEIEPAITDLREALNEQPKAAELLMLMAQAYERSNQKELADRQYTEAVRATEYNPAVVLRYVAFLQRDANAARAEEFLVDAIRRNQQSLELLSSLAQVRLSRQNWAGALQIADALAKNEPTKALGDQIRAAALAGQNKPEESIAALERAHAAAPNALPPIVSLVRAYSAQKSYDKAEKLLQDVQRRFPDNAQLLVMQAQVELAKGAPLEAAKSLEFAITQQPKQTVGYSALADLYASQKKTDQAIEAIDRGLKELPGDNGLRMARAGLLDAKGQHEAAIEIYESILKDQPGSLVVVNNLASMLLDHRTDKESLDRAQALADRLRGAQAPQFLDTVGWALHLRGDHGAARPLLEQARAQLPNNAVVRFHLGLLYRALGDAPKAEEELKAAALLETEDSELKKKIKAALN